MKRATNRIVSPQLAYPDSSDVSDAVPTVSSYNNDALTLSLPVVNQVQVGHLDHYIEPPDDLIRLCTSFSKMFYKIRKN